MKKCKWLDYGDFAVCFISTFMGLFLFIFMGCGIPENMGVRSGIDPRNQDDDVRFRTTYYFRVFDQCQNEADNRPQNDSLYRFRMTGKANALFTKVHFESGTLKKHEIDPFGSRIKFNKEEGRFEIESKDSPQNKDNQKDKLGKIKEVATLATDLNTVLKNDQISSSYIKDKVKELAENKIREIIDHSSVCSDGKTDRRGFQILGPTGWKTFDQDERLVMAMSSSDKPLINALKEISGRRINALSVPQLPMSLAKERVVIFETEKEIKKLQTETSETTGKILDHVIEIFESKWLHKEEKTSGDADKNTTKK